MKIRALLKILVILVLLDLTITIFWVTSGLGYEVNPLMNALIQKSISLFAVVKLAITFAGIFLLHKLKRYKKKLIYNATCAVVFIYIIIVMWHGFGILINAASI